MSSRLRLGLLLGVSLLFSVMGLVVAAFGDWRLGLGNLGIFGLGAAAFAYQLAQFESLEGTPELLPLRGGVPMVASAKRRAFFIAITFGAGASTMLIGYQRNPMLWWLGLVMLAGAAVVGVLALFGVPAQRSIVFSPDGIQFLGGPAACLLQFDNVAQLQAAEWNGHIIVLLQPKNLAALLMTVPEAKRDVAGKMFSESLAYMAAPLTIWSSQFGLNSRSLMKTIERFVREPDTRAELGREHT